MNLFGKLKEMRMSLIDDDKLIRDSLCLFFEGEGCRLLIISHLLHPALYGTAPAAKEYSGGRLCLGL